MIARRHRPHAKKRAHERKRRYFQRRMLRFESLEKRALLSVAVGPEFPVNATTADSQFAAAASRDDNGDFVVVWDSLGQDGDGHGLFGRRFDGQGVAQGDEFPVNAVTAGDQLFADVAMNANGDFVVVWESPDADGIGIFGQRFDTSGGKDGDQFAVNTVTSGDQVRPAVGMADDGSFFVAWGSAGQDGDSGGIFGRRFDSDGQAVGVEFQVNPTAGGGQFLPDLAMNGLGRSVVVWESEHEADGRGIFGQWYDENGLPDGGEVSINTTTDGDQSVPAVALNAAGQTFVSWDSVVLNQHLIMARSFNSAGVAGSEIQVTTSPSAQVFVSDIAIDDEGCATLVWDVSGGDGSGDGVLGRSFSFEGAPQGTAFRVNTTTNDDQSFPVIAMDGADNFVVAWQSFLQDGDGEGIFGQRFFVNDAPTVDLNGPATPGTGFDATFVSGDSPVRLSDDAMTIVDVDHTTLQSATAVLTPVADGSAELLIVDTTGTSITASYDWTTGRLDLVGMETIEAYRQVLKTLVYQNTSGSPTLGMRTVVVTVNDGFADSPAAEAGVEVQAANDPPTVDLNGSLNGNGFETVFVEGDSPTSIVAADATLSDTDSATLVSASFTLTNLLDGDEESLQVDTAETTLSAIYDSGTGVLRVFGADSVANYEKVLRTATYFNDSQAPSDTSRVIEVTFSDGHASSTPVTATVQVVPVNDPPVVDLNGPGAGDDFFIEFSPGTDSVLITQSDMTVEDVDNNELASATAVLRNTRDGVDESLQVDTTGTAITALYDPVSGELELRGVDTFEAYQQVLRTLTYRHESPTPTPGTRTVEISASDGQTGSEPVRSFIDIAEIPVPDSSITGQVFADVNNNGLRDPHEIGLPNVPVTLTGPVSLTVTTDESGVYQFTNLPPGVYELRELHPSAFLDGDEVVGQPALGQAGEDSFRSIDLPAGTHATGYHFVERGLRADFITKQLLLASTPTTGQLAAEFVTRGDQWYRIEAEQASAMMVDIDPAGQPFTVEVYSSDMLPVGLFAETSSVSIPASEGESFVLHVAATVPESAPPIQVTAYFDEKSSTPDDSTDPVLDPRDVNQDGVVTPLDVLLVLHAINRSLTLAGTAVEAGPVDVSGDGLVTPVDVLLVIDYLNDIFFAAASEARGEGEGCSMSTSQILVSSDQVQDMYLSNYDPWGAGRDLGY